MKRAAVPPVVHVCGYYPPHVGGIEACAQQISRELVRRGVSVRVVTSRTRGGVACEEPVPLPVRRLASFTFAHTPWMLTLPAVLFRVSRGSLLHLHVSHVFTDVVAAGIARLTRRPLVAHFHMDVGPSGSLGGIFELYKRHVLGPVLRSAAQVVALSAEQRDLVVQRYSVRPEHVTVVPNGVAEEFFVDERNHPPPGSPLRVLFVGRLAAQKKLERLFAALRELDRPYHLDVVGDGELRDFVAAEAGRMPVGSVVLWGSLSGEELRTRYREADVFVLTSEREGMPVALLEAMAARLPVVTNDVQGLREFVSGVGLLGDATDPAAFAGLLRRLADDPSTWRRMSDASAAFARASRWSALVVQLEDVYLRAWDHRCGSGRDLTSRTHAS